jgi:L-fuculose-phosphate aldolase
MNEKEIRSQILDACHGLAASGLGNIIGGHVSIRVPGKDLYWTNVLDLAFEEMGEDDLLLVDFDGRIVEGNRPISPGIDFHQGIYKLRPDINAIVHTHGEWGTTQAAFCRPLKMYHNLSTYFYKRIAVSPDDTIEAIGPVLGQNIAVMMPWHGAITLGRTIAEAAALQVTYEYAAKLDVRLADRDAPEMPEDACARLQVLLGKADYLELTWDLMRRRARGAIVGGSVLPKPPHLTLATA